MEGHEIHEMFERLNREVNEWDGEGDSPVDQWLDAREIDAEDLVAYSDAVAHKIAKACIRRGGVMDLGEIASRVSVAFQLGFEVAARRYDNSELPSL